MLFKALLNRLNGGTDVTSTRVSSSNRRSCRLVYDKYPNLPGIISRLFSRTNHLGGNDILMNKEALLQDAQRVFLALEILERSGLPPGSHAKTQEVLDEQMGCRTWAIRDKAARTLSLLINENSIVTELDNLLDTHYKSHNVLHGRFLCARYLVLRQNNGLKGEHPVHSRFSIC